MPGGRSEARAPFRGAAVHFTRPFHARDEQSKEQEKREKSLLRGSELLPPQQDNYVNCPPTPTTRVSAVTQKKIIVTRRSFCRKTNKIFSSLKKRLSGAIHLTLRSALICLVTGNCLLSLRRPRLPDAGR